MKKGAEENEGGSLVVFPWESALPCLRQPVISPKQEEGNKKMPGGSLLLYIPALLDWYEVG